MTTKTKPEFPAWITEGLTPYHIAAVLQGGCASGAYMPAVTYHSALKTMGDHGDDVCEYIADALGELPNVAGLSWSGLACHYLSLAVELWCAAHEHLADWESDDWSE